MTPSRAATRPGWPPPPRHDALDIKLSDCEAAKLSDCEAANFGVWRSWSACWSSRWRKRQSHGGDDRQTRTAGEAVPLADFSRLLARFDDAV